MARQLSHRCTDLPLEIPAHVIAQSISPEGENVVVCVGARAAMVLVVVLVIRDVLVLRAAEGVDCFVKAKQRRSCA